MKITFIRNYYTFKSGTSIDIDQDKFNIIVGDNGAGKTTFLNTLLKRNRMQLSNRYIHIDGVKNQGVMILNSESFRAQTSPYIDSREELRKNNLRQKSHGEAWKEQLSKLKSRINNNTFIIMDEPETSLSTESQIELGSWLVEVKNNYNNMGAAISTHSLLLIEMLGERVIHIPDCIQYEASDYLLQKRRIIDSVIKNKNY